MSDLIDRDKAIEAIEHYIDEVRNIPMGVSFKEGVKDGYYRAICIIKRLPSAERVGHWILVTDSRGQHCECSICGEWKYHQNQKYCGECGARMVSE